MQATTVQTADLRALGGATGLVLGEYREAHVAERVRRAVEREEVAAAAGLLELLRRDPEARARFRRAVAVSVSGFCAARAAARLVGRRRRRSGALQPRHAARARAPERPVTA